MNYKRAVADGCSAAYIAHSLSASPREWHRKWRHRALTSPFTLQTLAQLSQEPAYFPRTRKLIKQSACNAVLFSGVYTALIITRSFKDFFGQNVTVSFRIHPRSCCPNFTVFRWNITNCCTTFGDVLCVYYVVVLSVRPSVCHVFLLYRKSKHIFTLFHF